MKRLMLIISLIAAGAGQVASAKIVQAGRECLDPEESWCNSPSIRGCATRMACLTAQ